MDTNRLTIKSQEAMQSAQAISAKRGHIEIDGEHLLLALLQQEGGLIPNLLTKMSISPNELTQAVEQQLIAAVKQVTEEGISPAGQPGPAVQHWQ